MLDEVVPKHLEAWTKFIAKGTDICKYIYTNAYKLPSTPSSSSILEVRARMAGEMGTKEPDFQPWALETPTILFLLPEASLF